MKYIPILFVILMSSGISYADYLAQGVEYIQKEVASDANQIIPATSFLDILAKPGYSVNFPEGKYTDADMSRSFLPDPAVNYHSDEEGIGYYLLIECLPGSTSSYQFINIFADFWFSGAKKINNSVKTFACPNVKNKTTLWLAGLRINDKDFSLYTEHDGYGVHGHIMYYPTDKIKILKGYVFSFGPGIPCGTTGYNCAAQ